MKFTDEILIAYVDHELDEATRAQVEDALHTDPEIARRVDEQRALADRLRSAFAAVLDEPVPQRLRDAVGQSSVSASESASESPSEHASGPASETPAKVIDLDEARTARRDASADAGQGALRFRPWQQWGGMAASLMIGVLVGYAGWHAGRQPALETQDGAVVARGALARALTGQLASAPPADAMVRIGLSFKSKSGEYCRSFTLTDGQRLEGLACRIRADWRIEMLVQSASPAGEESGYRMAASPAPPAILQAVEERMMDGTLDAEQEKAAMQAGWNAPR